MKIIEETDGNFLGYFLRGLENVDLGVIQHVLWSVIRLDITWLHLSSILVWSNVYLLYMILFYFIFLQN